MENESSISLGRTTNFTRSLLSLCKISFLGIIELAAKFDLSPNGPCFNDLVPLLADHYSCNIRGLGQTLNRTIHSYSALTQAIMLLND